MQPIPIRLQWHFLNPERVVTVGVLVLLLSLFSFQYFNSPFWAERIAARDFSFGAEYGNIAKALIAGRGFADPFGAPTGPTAWMPPLLVFYLAGIFTLFGVGTPSAIWAAMLSQFFALALCGGLLVRLVRFTPYRRYWYVAPLMYAAFLGLRRRDYVMAFHDTWLIHLLLISLTVAFVKYWQDPARPPLRWLLPLAVLLPLTSPNLALAFVVLTALTVGREIWCRSRNSQPWFGPAFRTALALAAVFVTSIGLWTARNYVTFDQVIPVKSNFWYDFHQANVLESGVVDNETFFRYHPYINTRALAQYTTDGEVAYMKRHATDARQWLADSVRAYGRNVAERMRYAFAYTTGKLGTASFDPDVVTAADQHALAEANLIVANIWICLSDEPSVISAQLARLALSDPEAIYADWLSQRTTLQTQRSRPQAIVLRSYASLVPALCVLLGLLIRDIRRQPAFWIPAVLYLIYLTPYVAVSIYRRYLMAAVPLQIVLESLVIMYFLHQLGTRLRRRARGTISAAERT